MTFRERKLFSKHPSYVHRVAFLESLGNYRARKSCFCLVQDIGFKSFENFKIKLLAEEMEWTGQWVRNRSTFPYILILKYR